MTIVQQLVSSIPQTFRRVHHTNKKNSRKGHKGKLLPLRIMIRKVKKLNQILGHESLSGEKDVEKNRRVNQQDPGQESLSGDSGVEENVYREEQDLEDKICPGSSDG